MVGGDVLGLGENLDGRDARRSTIHGDDPEIVVGGCGFDLVMIRGVANLLSVGREGVVVLSAEREDGRVVVSGCEVAGYQAFNHGRGARHLHRIGWSRDRSRQRNGNHKQMAALARFVGVPMAVEEATKDQRLDLRIFCLFHFFRVAGDFGVRRAVALGIYV